MNQEEEGQSYLQQAAAMQAAAMQEADIPYPAMKDTLNQLEQLLNNLTQTEENQEGVGES